MFHPLLRLAASEPHLIGDHVEAYADLLGDEVKKTSTAWAMRAALFAAAGLLAVIGIVFAGVAVMLWAALPPSGFQAPWVLVVVPLLTLVLAVAAFLFARKRVVESAFERVKQQLRADLAVLREVSAG